MSIPVPLLKAASQPFLFAASPRREDLMRLDEMAGSCSTAIYVHRNYAFEFVTDLMPPFLAYGDLRATFTYGPYDDSLTYEGADYSVIQLVTLDFSRYADDPKRLAGWLAERLRVLRQHTSQPIIVSNCVPALPGASDINSALEEVQQVVAGIFVWDWNAVYPLCGQFHDDRMAVFKGTRLSDAACIQLARHFSFMCLPPILRPRIKAIAVDLDHTLYAGVLGEDGPDGIRIDAEYQAIHQELLRLRAEGIFIAVISRNEAPDVWEMFDRRPDLLLRREHLSASYIGWDAKSEGLRRIADNLRIAPDALLFIDDNPGEIADVASHLARVNCLHAAAPWQTLYGLRHFPGLNGYRANREDLLRVVDLAAENERKQMRAAANDPEAYFRSLQIRLGLAWNPTAHKNRLVELSNKTNQFNTGLRRFSDVDVSRFLSDPQAAVVTATMADRLSDSGIIAALFLRLDSARTLHVDEICISCRALGRGVENTLVALVLSRATAEFGAEQVIFHFHEGPRNQPARLWLGQFSNQVVAGAEAEVALEWSMLPDLSRHLALPIASQWE